MFGRDLAAVAVARMSAGVRQVRQVRRVREVPEPQPSGPACRSGASRGRRLIDDAKHFADLHVLAVLRPQATATT